MKAVAVRELESRLGAYPREAARGQTILVTDRGWQLLDADRGEP